MQRILKAARSVHKSLGPGLTERTYHNAMEVALKNKGIPYKSEVTQFLEYKGERVGHIRSGLIVDNSLLIELKSTNSISSNTILKTKASMDAFGLDEGLILNFGTSEVGHQSLKGSP